MGLARLFALSALPLCGEWSQCAHEFAFQGTVLKQLQPTAARCRVHLVRTIVAEDHDWLAATQASRRSPSMPPDDSPMTYSPVKPSP